MSVREARMGVLAVLLVIAVAAPWAPAGSAEASGEGDVGSGADDALLGASSAGVSPLGDFAAETPGGQTGLDGDDPGPPAGYPNENTLGYTTKGSDLDRWIWDTSSGGSIELDMGDLANKDKVRGADDYWLAMGFAVVGFFWTDGDGEYDPVTGPHDGDGDDPCPEEPFDIFTIYVNGEEIETIQGHNMSDCTPGGPEPNGRTFEIVPIGDDPAGVVRVPKNVVTADDNTVRIEVHDLVLPATNRFHSESSDGWVVYMDAILMELVAPPMVTSHGWSSSWNPPQSGGAPWQATLKANLVNEAKAHFGQDPWQWAKDVGGDGIYINKYDPKQDFRKSARELRTNVNAHFRDLGYSGDNGWIHGHSMGGLVTRYYVEVLGGSGKITKLSQTGTPNLGSWEAGPYTLRYFLRYEATDEEYVNKLICRVPNELLRADGQRCFAGVPLGWRDWWTPAIGAYEWQSGPGQGRDHLADFLLKSPSANPILSALNTRFPAGDVDYFTVRGDCSVLDSKLCALSGFWWRGDGAVGLDSATMNGAIPFRTLNIFHEDLPAQVETARWFIRYYADLDLNTGKPSTNFGQFQPDPFQSPLPAEVRTQPGGASDANVIDDGGAQSGTPSRMAAWDHVQVYSEDLIGGAYVHEATVGASGEALLGVQAARTETPLDVWLEDPNGEEIRADNAEDLGIEFVRMDGFFGTSYTYRMPSPVAGTYQVFIDPEDAPPQSGIPLLVLGMDDSAVEMAGYVTQTRFLPGTEATILAELTEDGAAVTGADVVAEELGTDQTLVLVDDGTQGDGAAGDGIYGARFQVGDEEGTLRFQVDATDAAADFVRTVRLDVTVAAFSDVTVTDAVGTPADAWGGDSVTLEATIASQGERAVEGTTTVSFFDGDPDTGGTLLGSVDVEGPIEVGESATVSLDTTAPAYGLDLVVQASSFDVDLDPTNNALAKAMPFVRAPRTEATVTGTPGENGWMLGPATLQLDQFGGAPATERPTQYRIEGQPEAVYTGPVTVATEGDREVTFWADDPVGGLEPIRETRVAVDLAPPTGELLAPLAGHLNVGPASVENPAGFTAVAGLVQVEVAAADTGSSVHRVTVGVDGTVDGEATDNGDGTWSLLWDAARESVGNHVMQVTIYDEAGRATLIEQPIYVLVGRTVEVEPNPNDARERLVPGGA